MSQQLISRSDDLRRLRDEGYEVSIRGGYLLIRHVPFRDAAGDIAYGSFASTLTMSGETTAPPDDHRMWFIGGIPHDINGVALADPTQMQISDGVTTHCMFSRKPVEDGQVRNYRDYFEKVMTHLNLTAEAALAIDPTATAITHP